MKKLAHARISEYGTIWGEAGDQTGHEVEVTEWDNNWTKLFRFKNKEDAKKAAEMIVAICNNDNVGYSQNNGQSPRTSLLAELQKNNWDVSKIGLCNCDCSSLMATILIGLGYNVSKDMWTGNQEEQLRATGKFDIITNMDEIQNGDIMWRKGHTAMAIVEDEKKYDYIATGNLWIRETAGTEGDPVTVIPYGRKVVKLSNPWVMVEYEDDGKIYQGWSSTKYLQELNK